MQPIGLVVFSIAVVVVGIVLGFYFQNLSKKKGQL